MRVEEARRQFPHTWSNMVYLNHAAVSPMSFVVRAAIDKYLERRALKGIEPYPWAMKMALETKILLSRMLHCEAEQIAFVLNTSDGLNIVAQGIDWKAGDRVIINSLEFPSNVYPFLNLKRQGVEIDTIQAIDNQIRPEQIAERLTDRTKIVSISHVQFGTGAKADLAAIGALCRERDILFVVDAIQSLPHCYVDVEAFGIDFLASGSHKWLMAPEGTGFIYVGDRALSKIHQAHLGWTSVEDPFNFAELDPNRLRPGAGRFENGTLNLVGIAGLKASLEFFFEFGLHKIEDNVLALSGYLIDRLERRGVEVLTPKDAERRAGIVVFAFDDPAKVQQELLSKEIVISLRAGRLRAAPHYYNTEEEINKLLVALFA